MTNAEYFEKNKISFAEAMEIFNAQKSNGTKSFDEFLASKHVEHKFKVGDIVVLQLNEETRHAGWKHNAVFEVIDVDVIDGHYVVKCLTPGSDDGPFIGDVRNFSIGPVDRNCVLY